MREGVVYDRFYDPETDGFTDVEAVGMPVEIGRIWIVWSGASTTGIGMMTGRPEGEATGSCGRCTPDLASRKTVLRRSVRKSPPA